MPCLIATRSSLKRLREKKQQQPQRKSKNKNFKAKIQYLNLKATRHKVKLQSEKNPNYTNIIFLTTQQMGFFLNEIR